MTDVLKQLSEALGAVVDAAGRSVVRVEGRRRGPSSGVVYGPGVVVTASHTVEWDEDVTIGLPDGTSAVAKVAGRDPGTDLAALRVDAEGLVPADWGEPDGLAAGHVVLGLTRPGRKVRANLGIVSVRGEACFTPSGGKLDHDVRVDIGLHQGFSGGLLVDAASRALGVTTAGLLRATPVLVPSATVRRVTEALLAHGRVRRGYLGIGTQGVRLPAELQGRLGQMAALLVVSVQPETPASRAGLMLGDVLATFGGEPVRHPGELIPLLGEERIGQDVPLRIVRAGEVRDVHVTVAAHEEGGS